MRLTCPCCGASYTLEVLLADRSAREAVAAALTLPASLSERLLRYIGLFRPRERALSWGRVERLLTDLQADIGSAQIEWDGRIYPAPVEYWQLAIDQMLDNRERLDLPMKSHGYLYTIIAGLSKRADDKRMAQQEVIDECARAREGERTGAMQNEADSEPLSHRERGRGEGAPRVPPPPGFRQLVQKLTGKTVQESADGQAD